jgi:hypothetical protein
VQLGHGGSPCSCPSPGPPGFMVFDTLGVHSINIDYCECPNDSVPDRRTQLLRQGWFPATFTRPNSVFTFDCLDTFHELSLQGKGNLYDFYHSLLRKTDNTNISDSIVRFDSLALSLTYKTSYTVSIQRDAQGLSHLAQPDDPQACWARSRP